MNVEQILERLSRRVLLMIGRGTVTLTNDDGPVQLVQIQVNELETIDAVPRVAEFGFSSVVPHGTDISFKSIAGDRRNSVAVATNDQKSRPRGLNPGESMLYSEDGKQIYLTATGGIVVDAKGQPVVIIDASDVTVNCTGKFKVVAPGGVEFDTPNVTSTGDITDNTATGNVQSMKASRATFDEHDHDIKEVQGGSSTLTSERPNQQE